MTKFKIIAAAITLTLSGGASAALKCCPDMACCHEGADCCDHAKGEADGHTAHGDTSER